jgi:hypothetical protein
MTVTQPSNQLEADLETGVRGGNKARLIARCYRFAGIPDDYEQFRATWIKKTFVQIHEAFDAILPQRYRYYRGGLFPAAAPAAAPDPKKELTKKAQKMAKSFAKTKDLTDEQRQWVIDNGGVEALDSRKQLVVANGQTFPFLDSSWFIQAQIIQCCIEGRKQLV